MHPFRVKAPWTPASAEMTESAMVKSFPRAWESIDFILHGSALAPRPIMDAVCWKPGSSRLRSGYTGPGGSKACSRDPGRPRSDSRSIRA